MTKAYEYKDRDWLYYEYVVLEKSLSKIGKECGMSGGGIYYWLQKYNISRRTVSESLMGENNPMYGKIGENSPIYGTIRSKKTRAKMSVAKTGENHPMYGKPRSEETKIRQSIANMGKIRSEESKFRQGVSIMGENNHRYIDGRTADPQYDKRRCLKKIGLPDEFIESALYKKKDRTDIELAMEYWLINNGVFYEFQKYINLFSTYTKVDFFIKPNICLYCDGNRWHESEKARIRDERITRELEEMDYRVIRIRGSDIHNGIRPLEILEMPQPKYEQQLLKLREKSL